MQYNIPKIVHYCWFGKKEKPKNIKKCIATWKEVLNDYEFIEWNEQNFDINYNNYVKEAYNLQKYAFVSDIARIVALKKFGGIYLDTDVKVIKKFDDLLDQTCILGFEEKENIATSFIAVQPNHILLDEFLDEYKDIRFVDNDGNMDLTPNVIRLGNILTKRGLKLNGCYQKLDEGIVVYPKEYFSPYDYINCINQSTKNTYCIHLFYVTWMPIKTKIKKFLKKIIVTIIGKEKLEKLRIYINEKNNFFN